MRKYSAIIVDIKDSKQLDDVARADCQEKMNSIVDLINMLYYDSLKENVSFSAGDSVQGLFTNPVDSLCVALLIRYLFYPYQIRAGIGYGMINDLIAEYKPLNRDTNYIDGQCYHYARSAIDFAKEANESIVVESDRKNIDIVINQILGNADLLEYNQTDKQHKVFDIYNLLEPLYFHNSQIDSAKLIENIKIFICKNANLDKCGKSLEETIKKFWQSKRDYYLIEVMKKKKTFGTSLREGVSDCFGVTKENIRQITIGGNFDEIRKMHLSACILLEEIGGNNRD